MTIVPLFAIVVFTLSALVLAGNLAYLRRRRPLGRRPDLPSLSVLIPARNEAVSLPLLLADLLDQDHPTFEVVVVDDASTDGTGDLVEQIPDPRIRLVRSSGPPAGWLGKPHALHLAASHAVGDRFLFLDADVRLSSTDALARLGSLFEDSGPSTVLTGIPRFEGGGLLLVGQVPTALLTGLPWPLAGRLRSPLLSALNGQVWMIDAATYRLHEPHAAHRSAVLEDVMIARLLKRLGVTPVLADLRDTVRVRMYDDLAGAWRGFRKNAYLLLGGRPAPFLALWILYGVAFVIAPAIWPVLYVGPYALRLAVDRFLHFPAWVPLTAPVSYLLASLIQADSFVSHLARRVTWKDRRVSG